MRWRRPFLTATLWATTGMAIAAPAEEPAPLVLLAAARVEGAEVLDYDAASHTVLVTAGSTIACLSLDAGGGLTPIRTIDLAARLALHGEVTHVALAPGGQGVAAACFVPSDAATRPGLVVLFDTRGERFAQVAVGVHPDCCVFSRDADAGGLRFLVVADEGEADLQAADLSRDAPGSVSILDLRGLDAAALPVTDLAERVHTLFLCGAALTDRSHLRIHPARRRQPALDIEPEYIATHGDRAWVSLQENNAIAVIDLPRARILQVTALGEVRRTIDGADDGRIAIDTTVDALPMPDQIDLYQSAGHTWLVTADEGDDRGDDGPLADQQRAGELLAAGRLDPSFANRVPARLNLCRHLPDASTTTGVVDRPIVAGARSLSVWDADTLTLVGSTGDAFEQAMATTWPELFNADGKGGKVRFDARSDDRGPEPEGVKVRRIGERFLAFCTLERPGALALVDVTEPTRPTLLFIHPLAASGHLGPEGICFIPATDNPTGADLVLVGCETSGTVVVLRLDVGALSHP